MTYQIKVIKTGFLSVNTVILYDTDNLNCTIFDIGDFDLVDKFVIDNKFIPSVVIATHGHFDHLYGASRFCNKYNCPFAMSSDDICFINSDYINEIKIRAAEFGYINYNPPVKIDIDLKNQTEFNKMFVISVPGHSNGSLCFYISDLKTLISGDTLFYETVGRTDLIGGNSDLLLSGIRDKLLSLPDDTVVIPGHGYSTTIKHEKDFNPFLK